MIFFLSPGTLTRLSIASTSLYGDHTYLPPHQDSVNYEQTRLHLSSFWLALAEHVEVRYHQGEREGEREREKGVSLCVRECARE